MAYLNEQLNPQPKKNNIAINILILLILLFSLFFILIHFNILTCGAVTPAICDLYYGIISNGKPKILIVSGEEGIGDPDLLYETLKSPKFRADVTLKNIELATLPMLQQHQLVIVEKAREMSISELKMFEEYVNQGGKLVWIGDAGTTAPEFESDKNYFLKYSERKKGGSESFISPWARKSGSKQVSFDYVLGVEYIGNYCEIKECKDDYTGFLSILNQNDRLTLGISQNLKIYGDFSLVKINTDSYQKTLAILDYGSNIIAEPPKEYFWLEQKKHQFGKEFPAIVSTGLGGRVAYYSFPPEYFISEKMPIDPATGKRIQYWGILENMYYGMLYK